MSGKIFQKPIAQGILSKSGMIYTSNSLSLSALQDYLKIIFVNLKMTELQPKMQRYSIFFQADFQGFQKKNKIAKILNSFKLVFKRSAMSIFQLFLIFKVLSCSPKQDFDLMQKFQGEKQYFQKQVNQDYHILTTFGQIQSKCLFYLAVQVQSVLNM